MTIQKSFEKVAGIAVLFLLGLACLIVVRPFLTAILWSVILVYATWPLYQRVDAWLGQRRTLAAAVTTAILSLVLLLPFTVVLTVAADDLPRLVSLARDLVAEGIPPAPDWVVGLPAVGKSLAGFWNEVATDDSRLKALLRSMIDPASKVAISLGGLIGKGLGELVLSVFLAFFMYRSGDHVATILRSIMDRFTSRAEHLMAVAGATTRGVVYGIIGTALAQGILAGAGFAIAGVPAAFLLGFATFVASIVPMGPPLIWVPAAAWLAWQGDIGWAVFMAAWGLLLVSSVDNVIKPYLISKGSNLPFVLVFVGAIGGVLGFGFVGIFLGPVLLAVMFNVLNDWMDGRVAPAACDDGGNEAGSSAT